MALDLLQSPLALRCLALTGSFETSRGVPDCFAGLAGDFDGQGLSFGALQWNIGQGTLQPLLAEMLAAHEDVVRKVFGKNLQNVQVMLAGTRAEQLQWARSFQNPDHRTVSEPWKTMFQALGTTPEFQTIEMNHAAAIYRTATARCTKFGVVSERSVALLFDIGVQNGSISPATEALIRADFAALPRTADPMDSEVAKMQSIANRRAEAANPRFVEDVRTRKLSIANGAGTVHGMARNLEQQFAIRLAPAA